MMRMLDFLAESGQFSRRTVLTLIVSSGLAGGLLLGVINEASKTAFDSDGRLYYFLLFMFTLAAFAVAKRVALVKATQAGERAIRVNRVRLTDKIRHSELLWVEHVGRGDIYARLTQDTNALSQAVPPVFNGYQSGVVMIAGLLYVATVSWVAFFLMGGFLVLGGYIYTLQSRLIVTNLKKAAVKEAAFFEALGHLVDGFKEIKLNHRKNDDVHARVATIAGETEELLVETGLRYVNYLVGSQTMLYLLIASIVFVLPTLELADQDRILKLTAAGLFIVAPVEGMLSAYYFANKAKVALRNIGDLEERLNAALDKEEAGYTANGRWDDFQLLALSGLRFQYPGDGPTYGIGPIDLTIRRGTVTFLTGGNGSGKSTLLKVITGLYPPSGGHVLVDDQPIAPADYPGYRELFGPIFGDFHLFDRLYGLRDVDPAAVERLLDQMQIRDKTGFTDNAFTNLDLSTGQRKRLAMVITRMEDKPVCIFDEWAADQDPQFRRHFYEVLLPRLKAEGKTVIAATHDDAYFHHADQLIKLDYGQIV